MLLVQHIDGEAVVTELSEGKKVSFENLIGPRPVFTSVPFNIGNIKYKHSVFVDKQQIIQVIECGYLKWNAHLNYEDQWFKVDGSCQPVEVFLKDVVVVAKMEHGKSNTLYICDKQGWVPVFTNIYDTGKICISISLSPMAPPQNIISMIENTPSNTDLSLKKKFKMKLIEGKAYPTLPQQHRISHEITAFTKHIIQS